MKSYRIEGVGGGTTEAGGRAFVAATHVLDPDAGSSENAGDERDTAYRWLLLLQFRTF